MFDLKSLGGMVPEFYQEKFREVCPAKNQEESPKKSEPHPVRGSSVIIAHTRCRRGPDPRGHGCLAVPLPVRERHGGVFQKHREQQKLVKFLFYSVIFNSYGLSILNI